MSKEKRKKKQKRKKSNQFKRLQRGAITSHLFPPCFFCNEKKETVRNVSTKNLGGKIIKKNRAKKNVQKNKTVVNSKLRSVQDRRFNHPRSEIPTIQLGDLHKKNPKENNSTLIPENHYESTAFAELVSYIDVTLEPNPERCFN